MIDLDRLLKNASDGELLDQVLWVLGDSDEEEFTVLQLLDMLSEGKSVTLDDATHRKQLSTVVEVLTAICIYRGIM